MTLLAALISHDIKSLILTALVFGAVIWLIFFVLPLPPTARTIFAVLVAVALIFMLMGCTSDYQKSVDSRSVGIQGTTDGQSAGGKVVYSVHYR